MKVIPRVIYRTKITRPPPESTLAMRSNREYTYMKGRKHAQKGN